MSSSSCTTTRPTPTRGSRPPRRPPTAGRRPLPLPGRPFPQGSDAKRKGGRRARNGDDLRVGGGGIYLSARSQKVQAGQGVSEDAGAFRAPPGRAHRQDAGLHHGEDQGSPENG